MFSCFAPLLSKVKRVCHVIVLSSYPASSDGYIGRLQYKRAARLIVTIIGHSTKWRHKRQETHAYSTYMHIGTWNCIASLLMHMQTVQFSVVPSESLQMQKQRYRCCYTSLAIWLWITRRKHRLVIGYTICGLVALRAWPGFHT